MMFTFVGLCRCHSYTRCTCTRVHVYVRACVCICACMCTCMCMCIFVRMCIRHVCMYMPSVFLGCFCETACTCSDRKFAQTRTNASDTNPMLLGGSLKSDSAQATSTPCCSVADLHLHTITISVPQDHTKYLKRHQPHAAR